MSSEQELSPAPWLVGMRLGVGLAQGLALYLLYSAFDAKAWPATDGEVFAPLVLISGFVPLIVIQGVGNLRPVTLMVWTVAAAGIIAALAWYDVWRAWPVEYVWRDGMYVWEPRVLPSAALCWFLAAGLFIAHALISGGDSDRRFMASYPTHFDVAWKLGVQIALAFAFVGAFWLILWLGAALFKLINLDFFEKLIGHRWFAIPVTALATSASLHVSDVRAGLVRGIRTLALVLLSWLLPLMALIAASFLASLVYTGLAPLWATRHASSLVLTAAATLVVLINAAYQDGDDERKTNLFFGLAIRFASFLLLPTVALAAYALWLRVDQYGWTVDRVASAACVVVALSYAGGYALNAVLPSTRLIERWNFVTALLILGTLLALCTPLADPARISVASQIARLDAGKVKADAFDYNYLRWQGGRYGRDALLKLSSTSASKDIRVQADASLNSKWRYFSPTVPTVPENLASRLFVHPSGRALPRAFLETAWNDDPAYSQQPSCITSANFTCDVVLADMDEDGRDEILLIGSRDNDVVIYRDNQAVGWRIVGTFRFPYQCSGLFRDALLGYKFKIAEPPWHLKEMEILGVRFQPSNALVLPGGEPDCPK